MVSDASMLHLTERFIAVLHEANEFSILSRKPIAKKKLD